MAMERKRPTRAGTGGAKRVLRSELHRTLASMTGVEKRRALLLNELGLREGAGFPDYSLYILREMKRRQMTIVREALVNFSKRIDAARKDGTRRIKVLSVDNQHGHLHFEPLALRTCTTLFEKRGVSYYTEQHKGDSHSPSYVELWVTL